MTGKRSYYLPASQNRDLGPITARRAQGDGNEGTAIIEFGGTAGELWVNGPDIARQLLAAAFEAVRILDPDGAADAVFALIEGDALAKIRARILEEEEDAKPPECGAVCEHDCTCSEPNGHDGDHKTRGLAGQELCSWPQDAALCGAAPVGRNAPTEWRCAKPAGHLYLHETAHGGAWGSNTFEPDAAPDTETCGDVSSGGGGRCTEPPGHPGQHIAKTDKGIWLAAWSRATAPDTAQPEDIPQPASLADALKASLAAAQPEPETCGRCGAADVPLILAENGTLHCHNSGACGRRRQAAKAASR